MSELFAAGSLIALLSLVALEVVLGIDNVVFIAILSGKLPAEQQRAARLTGLTLAAVGRILLLLAITWVMTLDKAVLLTMAGREFTVKDLILVIGGVFLLGKATWEIHHSLESDPNPKTVRNQTAGFTIAIVQITLLDLVFSIDSVLTAIGMVKPDEYSVHWVPLCIMVTAILAAIAVMLIFSGPLTRFIQQHPTMKMLALAFLLLVGIVLVAEGFHQHIPRGYIYFAMGFSLFVELINLKFTKKSYKNGSHHGQVPTPS